jgi:hypothetical protein
VAAVWALGGGCVGPIVQYGFRLHMVSRYVRNMIKFKIMNYPVQSRHLPAHGPIAVANPPTPSLAPPFHTPSNTQRHPIPPLWASPNGAAPCTPGATPVKAAPLPVPVASYCASGSPPARTKSVLNHRHDQPM